ncbi:DUF2291 domain-containing protein [Phytohabitans sp. ZYX-F-186]|uniref:DUF2291 domain-containing protein n=1 Tax=Phytohabitans maris TaxID=3071409 RepID=A0ABU0ZMN0_9ACTN|nr:DUF2291 domain-containing protein [Phytohabitans sp. ZYX-F-186]MDQ7908298.1 DUF2291 domain-containing protein [Phytohabitans sp. ZYX-F-186]
MTQRARPAAVTLLRRPSLIAGVLLLALAVAIAATTKVVDTDEAASAGGHRFDATEYATERYDSEVVPAIEKNATAIAELLTAIAADPQAAGERYGHRDGPNARYAFAASGTGVAGKVSGTLLPLEIAGLPEGVRVSLQIGPAINGTALRDATGLITFDQFLNQLEYADASTELNNQVKAKVLAGVDAAGAEGSQVSFVGAFTYGGNPKLIQVTPIRLEIAP